MANIKNFVLVCLLLQMACTTKTTKEIGTKPEPQPVLTDTLIAAQPPDTIAAPAPPKPEGIAVGAARVGEYLPLLAGQGVALVVNQTSTIGGVHLADTLQSLGIPVRVIFAPEHGFRGQADAGEKITDGRDPKTGIPIISLYGKKKKPSAEDLKDVSWVIFDIQDVGARFYTYIQTMHYVMEACAETGIRMMVLDRPNPNGNYVDGPVLKPGFQSFVGIHPVPIVHGMTIGEYAGMINGERWLKDSLQCRLTVIPVNNYHHGRTYELPIKPSPNLPNNRSIYLYPSLCLFEGTAVSVGRGTDKQFQVYGHPDSPLGNYYFTPEPKPGATQPPLQGLRCRGFDLSNLPADSLFHAAQIDLGYLIDFYQAFPNKVDFFLKNNFIDKLAGSDELRKQIIEGKTEAEIRTSWEADLAQFKKTRAKYLLYPDGNDW